MTTYGFTRTELSSETYRSARACASVTLCLRLMLLIVLLVLLLLLLRMRLRCDLVFLGRLSSCPPCTHCPLSCKQLHGQVSFEFHSHQGM